MWRKHRCTFQNHIKNIHNGIVKYFRVGLLQYAECIQDMYNLAKHLPPLSKKGREYNQEDCNISDKEFNEDVIRFATKDGRPTSMQDELED